MKNYLLLTASAVLVLSSCSNNEIVENHDLKTDGPKTMNFQTYVPGATRALVEAEEASNASIEENGFYLFTDQTVLVEGKEEQVKGFMTFDENDGWVMSGQQLQWSTDLNQEVQFYAVYSASGQDDNFSITQTGDYGKVLSGFDLTSGENDYMIANDTSSYNTANGNVALNFAHILAQVEVRIVGAEAGYDYYVGGVKITAPKSQSLIMGDTTFVDESETVVYALDEAELNISGNVQQGETKVPLQSEYTDDDVYAKLMVVPGTCSLSMKYLIPIADQGPSGDWLSTGYAVDDYGNNSPNIDIEAQGTKTFEVRQGYRNIITIKLNPKTKAMTFSVTVADWENENGNGQTIEL
jgi:hypothetical protein